MKKIRIENVSKSFHGDLILDNLNLEIPSGKFFSLLGPSGCGKTTLLRLIGGFEPVDSGKIYLGDEDITNQPIFKRRVNTVFQQYALFPHLSVFENVAYGLRVKKMKESDIKSKVMHTLSLVRLAGHEFKNINNLSGGQQQRVALARAIVNEPDVLLLDEPLAALDFNLREQMLIELLDLQHNFGTTFIYVTHDQSEALTVADGIAIFNKNGRIEQIGTPKEIYEFPASRFVATFVGNTNIIEGILHVRDNLVWLEVENLGSLFLDVPNKKSWFISGRRIFLSLRPEKILISKKEKEGFSNHLTGKVINVVYQGRFTQYQVRLKNGKLLTVFEQNEEHFPQEDILANDKVHLYFQKENVILLER
ncbi:TPA: spermidine/putrescine ABC transporter ATP-binding protein [Candidatus Dependentiae bacterium]|nr:MAG: Spermidine/putrescine import ATP-binding protein PotA [candidate division TM6 bacterium GW2011_GWE2_31_21]KKP53098.1 MAG: Spermidine/putrescine import ATP-binding protein PotA [candidate division TM6 bacterium GW2011_GWF2_33_332]HBS47916.1 spermidine/putrescine ABC transporter ATP-binding protein [Candidatus Dependentiae bacterium]HBZ73480.1 spermidine/putrescine ABC transporter ATP-binding protein [Candidatus Dependentiae bacterium]